jgi:16S rRNA processing protein RimM
VAEELVTIGRIVKPHGLHGEVAVDVLSDVPGRFDVGTEVCVGERVAVIATTRPHQGRLLIRFEHIADRTAAERLRGRMIEAPPVDVSEAETYFAHELVGMAVIDEDGTPLGTVSALIELPEAAGYDLLEVARGDGSMWLLPAVDEYVEVDEDEDGNERLRLVDPPEGLLDPAHAAEPSDRAASPRAAVDEGDAAAGSSS